MFTRKSTYSIGSKENSRTLGEKDFRPSCHFYGSSSWTHENTKAKRKKVSFGEVLFPGGAGRKGSKRNLKKRNKPESSLTLKRFSWRRGSVTRVEFFEQGQGNEPSWFCSPGNHYNFKETSFGRIIGTWVLAAQLTNVQSWPPEGRRGGSVMTFPFPLHFSCSRGMCLSITVSCKELA